MMPLPWIRKDTAFPRNPKILALIAASAWRAVVVYDFGLCYAGEQGTDGFIPKLALPQIHGRPRDAQQLVEHRLWHEQNGAGWVINDWAEFQQSNSETRERGAKARAASLKANCVRWHGPHCGCWQHDSEPDSQSDLRNGSVSGFRLRTPTNVRTD
jgi:hypothetical protein